MAPVSHPGSGRASLLRKATYSPEAFAAPRLQPPVKPVLVPAQDHAVLLIQRARAKLAQHYHFYLWDSELLTQLGSKTDLGRIAERYGLPAPRTVSPRSRAEAEELCSRNATISELFFAYTSSETDNLEANLHFLDYLKLKKNSDGKV